MRSRIFTLLLLWLGSTALPALGVPPAAGVRSAAGKTPPKGAHSAPRGKTRARPAPLLSGKPPKDRQHRIEILSGLANPDPQLRADAAWRAGQRHVMAAYGRLRKLVRDPDPLVRRNAARALGLLGNREAAIVLVDRLPRERVADVLVELAIALGRLRHKPTRPFLLSLLLRRDPALKTAGITALGYLGNPADAWSIGRFLRSADAGERLAAATALGHLGTRLAIAPLRRILDDPSPAVQRAVVDSLAGLRARGAIPKMLALLPRAGPQVALAIVRALAHMNVSKARSALERLLARTRRPRLAAEAALALAHLAAPLPGPRLLDLLSSRSNNVRLPAARASGLGGVRAAIPLLEQLLAHPHPELRLAAAEALGRLAAHQSVATLLERIRVERGRSRAAFVRTLGRLRAVKALPLLARLLPSRDPRVVAAAAAAIGEIALLDRRPVKPLARRLALLMTVRRSSLVAREGALAFARLRPRRERKGFARMLRLTLHRDPSVRARALRSLGLYRDPLAAPSVLRLLGDDNTLVYSQAALAAGRLRLSRNLGTLQTLLTQTSARSHPVARARVMLGIAIIDLTRRPEALREIQRILLRGPNTPAKADLVAAVAATRGSWVLPLLAAARRSPCYLVRAEALRALSIWPPAVVSPPPRARPRPVKPRRPMERPTTARGRRRDSLGGPFPTPRRQPRGCSCEADVGSPSSLPPAAIPALVLLLLLARPRARWGHRKKP